MKLVEVIRGIATSDETVAIIKDLSVKLGKVPIEVQEAGIRRERILVPMITEAIFVLQEGLATAAEIDEGMKLGANHPMGPLALADLVGLDTLLTCSNIFTMNSRTPSTGRRRYSRKWCVLDGWAVSPAKGFTITAHDANRE